MVHDYNRVIAVLRRLKTLGVHIAMDDFGTGYSSLSYLHAFPFDKIKVDQSFVSNIEQNRQSAALIRGVIGLSKGLGLPVLLEGVETKEQFSFLVREACDEIQGYLIGRPRPIVDTRNSSAVVLKLTAPRPDRSKRMNVLGRIDIHRSQVIAAAS